VDAVREITGGEDDWVWRPGERADQYLQRLIGDEKSPTGLGEIYLLRRDVGRRMEECAAAIRDHEDELLKLGGPPKPDELRSTAQIAGEIGELTTTDDHRRRLAREVEQWSEQLTGANAKLGEIIVERDGKRRLIEELTANVAELDARINRAQTVSLPNAEGEWKKVKAAVEDIPDPAPRLTELRRQLQQSEDVNKSVRTREVLAETLDQRRKEHAKHVAEHKRRDGHIDAIRELRKHLLDGVDLGVPGLAIGDGTLLVGGIPYGKAATSERLRVACAVAMRQRPRLRLLRVDDGERLDREHREELLRIAGEHGYQVLITTVSDAKDLHIEIRDRQTPNPPRDRDGSPAKPAKVEV
jgi:hypothetical protein